MADNFIEEIIEKDLAGGKVKTVVTRFPPEPNGYLHIGHAKSIFLNSGIAKKYNGRFNLRFDDTNPAKEDVEYIEAIKSDLEYLGVKYDEIHYASDYYPAVYNYAKMLIRKGLAYVCDLSADEIRETRGTLTEAGKESPYRNRTPEENLALFERMKGGEFADGTRVLRAKIDMASPNINMRDPVLYRIMHKTHHRTGDEWCIYPMYDFIHPISDALEGITHSICTLEFEDHRPLYNWTVENCEFINGPQQIEFAKLYLSDTIVGKRYLKKIVDDGLVVGWFDPRMPTISGMKNKGYPAEALKDFCGKIGVSKSNSKVDLDFLQFCIRENLNANAERAFAVLDPILVTLTNYSGSEELEINTVQSSPEQTRKITFSDKLYIERDDFAIVPPPKYKRLTLNGYVRLKGAYIIKCDEFILNEHGDVKELKCSVVENSKSGHDESGIKVKGVIHFVDANNCDDAKIVDFENLFMKADEDTEILEVNPNSSIEYPNAKVERYLSETEKGERFQFLRKGYYVNASVQTKKKELVFTQIVALKDGFNSNNK